MKYITGFGQFWWDFIVGDSVVLAVGGIALIALGYGLVELDLNTVAEVVLPLSVAGTLCASLVQR